MVDLLCSLESSNDMPRRNQITPQERRIRVYRERNRVIRAMGFTDYKDYLKSDLWASIRERRSLTREAALSKLSV
jgi:hypothetical protein